MPTFDLAVWWLGGILAVAIVVLFQAAMLRLSCSLYNPFTPYSGDLVLVPSFGRASFVVIIDQAALLLALPVIGIMGLFLLGAAQTHPAATYALVAWLLLSTSFVLLAVTTIFINQMLPCSFGKAVIISLIHTLLVCCVAGLVIGLSWARLTTILLERSLPG